MSYHGSSLHNVILQKLRQKTWNQWQQIKLFGLLAQCKHNSFTVLFFLAYRFFKKIVSRCFISKQNTCQQCIRCVPLRFYRQKAFIDCALLAIYRCSTSSDHIPLPALIPASFVPKFSVFTSGLRPYPISCTTPIPFLFY